jgi:hypothetical protein
MRRGFLALFLLLVLSGCEFPTSLFFEPPPVDGPVAAVSDTPAPPPTPVLTDTPVPPTDIPCTYAWANNSLPDETALVQEALKKAGLGTLDASLSAYGENCIDTLHNKVVRFSVLQTDFYINIPVADTRDKVALGNLAAKALGVVAQFPPGKVPGPNLGQCTLNFQDLSGQVVLVFGLSQAQGLLDSKLSGETLYNALAAHE